MLTTPAVIMSILCVGCVRTRLLVSHPITTQSTQAATTPPAIFVPRCDLKRAEDKVEPLALNSVLESRQCSLLAGNRKYKYLQVLSVVMHCETKHGVKR